LLHARELGQVGDMFAPRTSLAQYSASRIAAARRRARGVELTESSRPWRRRGAPARRLSRGPVG